MLTDDDADDRIIFSDAFRELHIENDLQMFPDGIELMDYLNKTTDLPEILFLDLNMPKKTGIDCLLEIRAIEKLRDLTVAIYSTSASTKDIEETFIKGATIYIKKPCDFQRLKAMIRDVVYRRGQGGRQPINRDTFLLGS
ncbi:MAG: response regulator [Flavobacterium sp.]|nr:response regulator [Flavobacterium sp.]